MCLYDARLPVRPGTPFVNDACRNEKTLETVETVAARAFQSVQTRVIEKKLLKIQRTRPKKRNAVATADSTYATNRMPLLRRSDELLSRFKRDDIWSP